MPHLHGGGPAGLPSFEFDNSLNEWSTPSGDWLVQNHRNKEWAGLATANVVFGPDDKVLLIQRASHDSMPNKWELPGGAVDEEDPSILYGAARELFEESGLVAKRFTHVVTSGPNCEPGDTFQNRFGTKTFCRFTFHVEVNSCDAVKLDPNEHQDFVWASEEDVRAQKTGDRDIPITQDIVRALIIEAFRLRKDQS